MKPYGYERSRYGYGDVRTLLIRKVTGVGKQSTKRNDNSKKTAERMKVRQEVSQMGLGG